MKSQPLEILFLVRQLLTVNVDNNSRMYFVYCHIVIIGLCAFYLFQISD